MSLLDRHRRRATMLGGPLDGDISPVPLPDTMAWPAWSCHLVAGTWQHYRLDRGRCPACKKDGLPVEDGLIAPHADPDPFSYGSCWGGEGHPPAADADATYAYAGECSVDNHDGGPLPHEHACCCGRAGCDGREIR